MKMIMKWNHEKQRHLNKFGTVIPKKVMENNKQFNPGMMVQQYVEIFSRKATTQANFQQPMKQEQIQAYNTQM